jgi:hypothetical protein
MRATELFYTAINSSDGECWRSVLAYCACRYSSSFSPKRIAVVDDQRLLQTAASILFNSGVNETLFLPRTVLSQTGCQIRLTYQSRLRLIQSPPFVWILTVGNFRGVVGSCRCFRCRTYKSITPILSWLNALKPALQFSINSQSRYRMFFFVVLACCAYKILGNSCSAVISVGGRSGIILYTGRKLLTGGIPSVKTCSSARSDPEALHHENSKYFDWTRDIYFQMNIACVFRILAVLSTWFFSTH